MSLVAYAASSDEDSDFEEDKKTTQVEEPKFPPPPVAKTVEDNISDDDDEYVQEELSLQDLKTKPSKFVLYLPKPKHEEQIFNSNNDVANSSNPLFSNLPLPRSTPRVPIVEEMDDEYLHKKAEDMTKEDLEKPIPQPMNAKGKIKITVPSLSDFSDVDQEKTAKLKNVGSKADKFQGSGLLSLLPKPKSEQNFAKKHTSEETIPNTDTRKVFTSARPSFIPDTVRHRRSAHNTEGVDGVLKKSVSKKQNESKSTIVSYIESDVSDDDDDDNALTIKKDFFSLNTEENLPEISTNEINALVAKRAAQMAEATTKYLNEAIVPKTANITNSSQEGEEFNQTQRGYQEKRLNEEAIDALLGKNAKRRRNETQKMQIIDISGTEVMPDRQEWLRTALSSSTTYQPTGVLNDEEPAAGTRRKHQITYLAHKAKSNEAELQAMWAANRQTRRATQSKYGF